MAKKTKQEEMLDHPWIQNELAGIIADPVLREYVARREDIYLRPAKVGEYKSGYLQSLNDPTNEMDELELYESIIHKRIEQHERNLPRSN
ncbi:MAG: hypothetical protein M3Q36_03050 [bacterium]|nr:hypothetical protein [bacterium]